MTLSQEKIAQHIKTPFRFYPSVDSTNDIARDWLLQGAEHGSVVIADEQKRGRGRLGRTWYTPPHVALAMSVILKPSPESLTRMALVGALAIAELCESVGAQEVGIKWPNDVQIAGRKVSGVLPEAVWQGDRLAGVVLGMGVNVNLDFDDTLHDIAINLSDAVAELPERTMLLAILLQRVHYWSLHVQSSDFLYAWQDRLTTLGRRVAIDDVHGIAKAVEPDGALLVQADDGTMHRIIAGEVRYITQRLEG
jgi:BirA family biotin operon repressor/biotin-[acetyl-CoA-carboxylase] ligase